MSRDDDREDRIQENYLRWVKRQEELAEQAQREGNDKDAKRYLEGVMSGVNAFNKSVAKQKGGCLVMIAVFASPLALLVEWILSR
jgi:hypothetical protein